MRYTLGLAVLTLATTLGCQTTKVPVVVETAHGDIISAQTSDDREASTSRAATQQAAVDAIKVTKSKGGTDAQSLARLSHLYLLKGDYKQAAALASHSLAIDFRNREAKIVAAYAAYRQERLSFATAVLKSLGGENANDADVVNLMALVAVKQGDEAEGLRLSELAASKDRAAVAPRLNAAILHLRHFEYAQAEKLLREAQHIDPKNIDVRLHLAVTCAALGHAAESERLYTTVREDTGDSALSLFNEATLYARTRRFDKAIKTFELYIRRVGTEPGRKDEALAAISDLRLERASHGRVTDAKISDLAEDAEGTTVNDTVSLDEDDAGAQALSVTSVGVTTP